MPECLPWSSIPYSVREFIGGSTPVLCRDFEGHIMLVSAISIGLGASSTLSKETYSCSTPRAMISISFATYEIRY